MNIVLIGYRGTGKSTVGRILAERLSRPVVSTDEEIVRREGRPIPEIVKALGWEGFREIEAAVCRELAGRDGLVIDTGGGAVLNPENVAGLKGSGVLVWLTAEVPVIARRIGGDAQRPSLTGTKSFLEEIGEVLREREPRYRAAADHVVRTDDRPPGEVAQAVLDLLGRAELLI